MGEYTLERAQAYIKEQEAHVNTTFKPLYHLTAPVGWINDPNGFVYFRGEYHVFYQYYPYDTQWGPMHWGHATSRDLLHWEHLPVAIAPDQPYDKDGCFSGSAIVKDDRLWLMYTGHIVNDDGSIAQVQNMAYSDDGVHFTKLASNPVMTGEHITGIKASDFRDPKVFDKDGTYYAVVAAEHVDRVGCIVLLKSHDLEAWQYHSIFLKGTTAQGIMWECPDYFNLNGQDCLIMSPMRLPRQGERYHNLNSNIICYGTVDWDKGVFELADMEELDYGHDYYATQTTEGPNGERVAITWMNQWTRHFPTHQWRHGWCGAMSTVKQLTDVNGQLQQLPFLPAQQGERETVATQWCVTPEPGSAKRLDIQTSNSQAWQLRIGSVDDYVTVSLADRCVTLDRAHVQTPLGGDEVEPVISRSITATEPVHMVTVFIDRSSVEVFINDGKWTQTAVCYMEQSTLTLDVHAGSLALQYTAYQS